MYAASKCKTRTKLAFVKILLRLQLSAGASKKRLDFVKGSLDDQLKFDFSSKIINFQSPEYPDQHQFFDVIHPDFILLTIFYLFEI